MDKCGARAHGRRGALVTGTDLTNLGSSTPPLSQSSNRSPPPPCPCPSHPPTRWHLPLEFYLRWGCVQSPTLQRPLRLGPAPTPWGEALTDQWPGAGLPQKIRVMAEGQRFKIVANHNTQLVLGFPTLWSPCPNTSKHGCSLESPGTFACGEAILSLPNVLQAGEPLLPVWHVLSAQTPLPAAGDSHYFLARAPPGTEL